MSKDYYSILGVSKNSTKEEIKKAFRSKAQKHHPDKGGDEAKFKEINEAYQTLSDDSKRAQYDRFGDTGASGQGYGSGFGGFNSSSFEGFDFSNVGDIFSEFFTNGGSSPFGGRATRVKKGSDLQVLISITFKESVFGAEKKILLTKTNTCKTCSGSGGKPGSKLNTCKTCSGSGAVSKAERTVFGIIQNTVECNTCHGSGKIPDEICATCKGKGVKDSQEEINIKVPAGIENGATLRMSGEGEATPHGKSGDLYVQIQVDADRIYSRKGSDIYMSHTIKLTDSLLGANHSIMTLDGTLSLEIPQGTNTGDVIKLSGKGVFLINGKRGDLCVKIQVQIPKSLSTKQKKIVDELKNEGI